MASLLILAVNPGSASRRYSLYRDNKLSVSFHFEFVDSNVICTLNYAGKEKVLTFKDQDLSHVSKYILPLLQRFNLLSRHESITAIGVRTVAPSCYFVTNRLVTNETIDELRKVKAKDPLHVSGVIGEIQELIKVFSGVPVVIISDSAFHSTKLPVAWHYGIDVDIADKVDIKRYGFHGVSVESVVGQLKRAGLLYKKAIVCHLGGGCSVTAVLNGKSLDNTMGYTPLEGVMMASRCGNIDISAALLLKKSLGLSDEKLEYFLDEQSGLGGVSGVSNDIRQLVDSEASGNKRAKLALDLFVYRLRQAIGQMAATLNGVDELVFTATIGERSSVIRSRIIDGLSYLNFRYDKTKNNETYEPATPVNIAGEISKPIIVICTDEEGEIARQTLKYYNFIKKS